MRLLGAAGIPKQHPEFKEFFGHVYRGVGFALVSLDFRDFLSILCAHRMAAEVENEDDHTGGWLRLNRSRRQHTYQVVSPWR